MDKSTYKRYLRTQHWQQLRQEVLRRANGYCEKCGYQPWKPNGLQVHPLTYSTFGNEKLDNLIAVCPRCHMALHGISGKRKPKNMKKNKLNN